MKLTVMCDIYIIFNTITYIVRDFQVNRKKTAS